MLAHQRTGGSCSPASACAHLSPPSSTGFRRFKPARSCAPCLSAADISSPSQRRAWVVWTLHPLRFSRHTVGVPSSSSSHGDSSKGWGGGQQGPGASQGWDSVSASDRAEPQHPAAAALRKVSCRSPLGDILHGSLKRQPPAACGFNFTSWISILVQILRKACSVKLISHACVQFLPAALRSMHKHDSGALT